jgi:alpha-ketoglutarate-dependent dioxygenase FTO
MEGVPKELLQQLEKFHGKDQKTSEVKLTKQQKRDLKRNAKKQQFKAPLPPQKRNLVEGSSVYKRATTYPAPFQNFRGAKDRFVTPDNKQYKAIVDSSYKGFATLPPNKFPTEYHDEFQSALETLDSQGVYQFDMTQPAGLGTKLARTFVTRCLVGDPGITYKYLGLRMFAYPWTEKEVGATESLVQIGTLNRMLVDKTKSLLDGLEKDTVGSCDYNLTLINRCFPDGNVVKLKDEPLFRNEKCTVSWHADSSLEHYSSIAVYHCTYPQQKKAEVKASKEATSGKDQKINAANAENKGKIDNSQDVSENDDIDKSWRLALKVHNDAEGPNAGKIKQGNNDSSASGSGSISAPDLSKGFAQAPPVAVPLPNKYTYFLLDDFNHHHQHSGKGYAIEA